jgi:tetratricopeptide (TPR) repeat protein
MKPRAEILGSVVVAIALSASSFASAEPRPAPAPAPAPAAAATAPGAPPTRADALFTAAKQLRAAGLYEDACPKFAETAQLEPGVGVMLYLADCYEHTGRSANAWAEFRKAEKLARERNDKRADLAKARAEVLEAKLTRLTIVVADPAKHAGLEVTVDGTRILPENWNSPLPTDPGDHSVEIREPGRPSQTAHIHLDPGAAITVPVSEGASPSTPSPTEAPAQASAPTPAAESAPLAAGAAARTYVSLGLLGLGAIGVTVGAGFLDAKNQATSKNQPSDAGTISAVSFAIGGAAFASAIVLYLAGPKDRTTALTLSPGPVASGTGAWLRGTF